MSELELKEVVEILQKVRLFADLKGQSEALNALASRMKRKKYPAHHRLTEQGQPGEEFYILIQGSVCVLKNTQEGDSYKVVVLTHDSYPAIGEGGLMEDEVRSATVSCETDVECLVLDRRAFDEFCAAFPHYALPVVKKIALSIMNRLNQTSQDLMLLHSALMDEIRSA